MESLYGHYRYMTIVSTAGINELEESAIIGFDITNDNPTIGLVIPVWTDIDIRLDGDGLALPQHFYSIVNRLSLQAFKSPSKLLIFTYVVLCMLISDINGSDFFPYDEKT